MQQTNEHKYSKIFLVMQSGVSIELQVANKLHIREIVQIARQEDQMTNQVLKIFKENQMLRSSLIMESNDLDGQVFSAQTLKKQQSFFYKRANSEPQEIVVEIEKQKIADIIQLIKKETGIPENKVLQAKLKGQILDQDRYFYEYRNILLDELYIQEDETPSDLQIPENKEEDQYISLKILYQNEILSIISSYNKKIEDLCINLQRKLKTTEVINLYQNYKKLNKNSSLANYLIVSQANLMACIQQKSYKVKIKYQNLEQELNIESKQSVNKLQEVIRSMLKIPQNINLSLKLNNIELDLWNNLEEYFIQDKLTIDIKVLIEDIYITINDIIQSLKEKFQYEHINFCAYEGKIRLNMNINLSLVQLKSNIITLWQIELNTVEKQVALCINVVDLQKHHIIQIAQDQKIKSLEKIIQEQYKMTENLQFYYNKLKICSDYTIKDLGIARQIQIDCQIVKKQYDIQVRYKGITETLSVWRNWLVSQLIESSKLLFQINKDKLVVIQDQTRFKENYELDNYLIDEIVDICEEGSYLFNLKVIMNMDTEFLGVIINYQSKVKDLYDNLTDKYKGKKFYVYDDRKKQQKKKLLREFDLNNLLACETNSLIKFDIQIQDQQKSILADQIVNNKQIIGDYFSQLFQNFNKQSNKLSIQNIVLDQGKRFYQYLIQENDKICIEIPDQIYKFQVDGSQLYCQLQSQKLEQFQEQKQTLTFHIKFFNKANQKYQITASIKSKLSDLLQRLSFTNFDINNIKVHRQNKKLDLNNSLDSLGIKMNDILEAFIGQQILLLRVSINKKDPKEYKINTLRTAQQLIDAICQREKLQPQDCKLYYNDKEVQNNVYLRNLQLKDGDLLEILQKQKPLLKHLSYEQITPKQRKQSSKSPYTKEPITAREQIPQKSKTPKRKPFCQYGPQQEICRCGNYKTNFS